MPDTVRLDIITDAPDALVADLADLGFDAFEETDNSLTAYTPAPRWDGPTQDAVTRALDRLGLGPATVEIVPDRDWNAEWEASLRPIMVGPFVIAPSWAEVDVGGRTLLRIDPKMAFGTGYHETTRICLRLLARADVRGRVLDVGTGTGVLALAALSLGADGALGVDIDPWSVTNGAENAALNGLADRFEGREGSLDAVPERDFDVVICNTIRSILLPLLPGLTVRAAPGAPLVVSGLLRSERDAALSAFADLGYHLADEASENEWWGARFACESEGRQVDGNR